MMANRKALRFCGWAILVLFASIGFSQTALGQGRSYPNEAYYAGRGALEDGDYASAAEIYANAYKSGLRGPGGRWIDSICYQAMLGECYFRMGEHARALEQFTGALQLYLVQINWPLRTEFPIQLLPLQRAPRPAIGWGVSRRNTRPCQIPARMLIRQGGFAANTPAGIAVDQNQSFSINATEIMRCTALAMYRRMEIMGPTCPYDPLTGQLVDALSRRPAPPNHWSQAWVDTLLGIAYASSNKPVQASQELSKSLRILGQYDHPLTPIALLTLGRIALSRQELDKATNFFYEATFPAAAYGQTGVIADAMSGAAIAHMVSGQRGAYPPLAPCAVWGRANSRALEGTMYIAAAANLAHGGATNPAAAMLDQARSTLRRSEMLNGVAGARINYLTALVSYQRGNLSAGNRAFQAAMLFQKRSSLRLFQTGLADQLYMTNRISDRIASNLYEIYLSDPQPANWAYDPMETIGSVLNPHAAALEHWFEVALLRKENEKALEIADLIRRRRFYSSLPMGGRLLSLRWVLEAPEAGLTDRALIQRRDILAQYPAYAALARRAAELRQAMSARPLVAPDEAGAREMTALQASLADVSGKQELMLQAIALQRDAADFAFPPPLKAKELRKSLSQNQVVLSFYSTNRYVYAFMISRENFAHWKIDAPAKVRNSLKTLLKEIGLHDKNQAVPMKDFAEVKWKETSLELTQLLFNSTEAAPWEPFDELVVVPDGMLWYLPFEVLQVNEGDASSSLVDKIRIRYAPTVALSQPDRRRMPPSPRTMVVAGKLYPKDDSDVIDEFASELVSTTGGVRMPDDSRTPPALVVKRVQQLIVAQDIEDSERGPYNWSPLPSRKGKLGAAVGDWMALPWGGPQQVTLPGYHTPAENSLKRGGAGNEVFLTVCGMMASGSRTVLISRWRVGGASTVRLVREYVQELPFQPASQAWQRSLELIRDGDLDPSGEPRVQPAAPGESISASHPFFWAGYMLVDTGVDPTRPVGPRKAAPMKKDAAKPGEAKPGEAKPAAGAAKPGDAAKPAGGM